MPARLSVPQMARDALSLMDAAGWESAHVVGHSLGGLVALCLALDSPRRVRSLALLCTFARGADATAMTPRMLWLGTRSRVGTRAMRRNAFLEITLPPSASRDVDWVAMARDMAVLFGHDLADQPPVAMKQLAAMRRYDATPRLTELAPIPTLVVSARHDPIARPGLGRALGEGIPGARFVLLDDASHGVTIHRPDVINGLLNDHLGGVP